MTMKSTLLPKIWQVANRIGNMTPDSTNPHFRSKYISLPVLLDALKEACKESKVGFTQLPSGGDKDVMGLKTIVFDEESDETLVEIGFLPIVKSDPQAGGSAYTYLRRYSLCSIFSIGTEDDDAHGATFGSKKPSFKKPAKKVSEEVEDDDDFPFGEEAPKAKVVKAVKDKSAPASEKQIRFIYRLIKTAGEDKDQVLEDARRAFGPEIESFEDLNKEQASQMIDGLGAS